MQNPHIQQFLWRRIVLDYPYTPWLMDGLICILFPASEFPRRVTLVHNGTTIHIFLRFHCLSFHMIFAQPSISDLEPHSRGSRIDGEGTLFSFPSMRHALLDCCSLTSLSSHKDLPLYIWRMKGMLRMQFEDLIEQALEEKGAGFVSSGQSKNVALEGLVVLEDLQPI